MKKQILTGLIIISSVLTLNAQIYTPSGVIQGSSDNNNVGIGTNNPVENLTIGDVGGYIAISDRRTSTSGKFASGYKFYDYAGGAASISLEHNGYLGNNARALIFSVNGADRIRLNSNGYLGIGANYDGTGAVTPIEKLTIGEKGGNFAVQDRRTATSGKFTSGYKFYDYTGESASIILEHNGYLGNNARSLKISVNGSERMKILANGNVLVGKSTQQNSSYIFDVAGSIRANEIKVNSDGADFVFEPDYTLKSLNEVELYIKENKHLPDIAPASKMQKDGVNIGEMNTQLLQKIEELTLYTIEQQKEIEELKKQNEKIQLLEKAIEELKEN